MSRCSRDHEGHGPITYDGGKYSRCPVCSLSASEIKTARREAIRGMVAAGKVYKQHNEDEAPGQGWEPFAVVGSVDHVIFWRRQLNG